MAQKVNMYKTRDGKVYYNKTAAERHERVRDVITDIDKMPGDEKTKDYIKKNWRRIRNLVEYSAGVSPTENVPDKEVPKNNRVPRAYKKRQTK